MKIAGNVIAAVGAGAMIAFIALLPVLSGIPQTLWDATTREPGILTALAAIVILLALLSVFLDSIVLPLLATGVAFYLLGQIFSDGSASYSDLGSGVWAATGAALAMSIGGIIATIGAASRLRSRGAAALGPAGYSPAPPRAAAARPAEAMPATAPLRPAASPVRRDPAPGTVAPQPARAASTKSAPPGWYPDPSGQARSRYWSGDAWTEHISS